MNSPAKKVYVREARLTDVAALLAHDSRHHLESGRDGEIIFAPMENPDTPPFEDYRKERQTRWSKSPKEARWERTWVLTDDTVVYGALRLGHHIGMPVTLHRALLMMGVERSQRAKGFGRELVSKALEWAKSQPSLDWVQLEVFDHNEPAKKLYKSFGFKEIGTTPDLFRTHKQKISNTTMALNLREA